MALAGSETLNSAAICLGTLKSTGDTSQRRRNNIDGMSSSAANALASASRCFRR
jgi:hypothetical protein